MRRSHYLLSFMLSRLVFLVLEVAVVVGFGWLAVRRARARLVLALAAVALLGAAAFAGLGLLVAARPRTIEAVSGWMNLVQLPMWLLVGTFFSYERFPAAVAAAHPRAAAHRAQRRAARRHERRRPARRELARAGWSCALGRGAASSSPLQLFRWQ